MSLLIDCCVDYTESAETVLLDDGMDPIQINAIASMWRPIPSCNGPTLTGVLQSRGGLVADAIRKPCSPTNQELAMRIAAAVAHRPRQPFVVEEVELPDLQQTDVLVRVLAVGICNT